MKFHNFATGVCDTGFLFSAYGLTYGKGTSLRRFPLAIGSAPLRKLAKISSGLSRVLGFYGRSMVSSGTTGSLLSENRRISPVIGSVLRFRTTFFPSRGPLSILKVALLLIGLETLLRPNCLV